MKKIIITVVSLVLVISMIPVQAFAGVEKIEAPTEVSQLISSNKLMHNFINITTTGTSLDVQCETPIKATEFNICVRRVEPASDKTEWVSRVYPMAKDGYYSFSASIPSIIRTGKLDGTYVLVISMKKKAGEDSITFYKNCNFKVTNGVFSILQYDDVLNENAKYLEKIEALETKNYKKKSLSDYKYLLLKDPVSKKVNALSTKKTEYIKSVSDKITKGATTDYEKLLKIYEYVGDNFYYDTIAFQKKTKAYVDPYRNLYNLRNKKKSANSENGKVATTCVGYSAAIAALARAQGIPVVLSNGHHVGMQKQRYNNWSTEENITLMDHWWTECYVDGRWIIVDATTANSSKWDREKKEWTYTGLTNYVYFDPTPEQFATGHMFMEVR